MNRAWRDLWIYAPILAVTLGGAYAYHQQSPPVYEAQARVRVPRDTSTSLDELLPPAVYTTAASLLEKQQVMFPERQNAELGVVLARQLKCEVEHGAGADEVLLRYSSTDPEAAARVLGVLLDAWLPQLPVARVPKVPAESQQERTRLDESLTQLRAQVANLQSNLAVVPDLPARLQTITGQVKAAIAERDAVDELREASRQQLETEAPKTVVGRWPEGLLKQQVTASLTAQTLDQEIQQHEKSQQKMARVYGRKHPKMAELVKKLDAARAARAALAIATTSHGQSVAETVILAMNDEWNRRQAAVEPLEAERQTLEARRLQVADQQTKLDEARRELERLEGQSAALNSRLSQIRLPARMQTEVLQPAAQMPDPVSPPMSQTLANGVIAGLVIGLILQAWSLKRRPQMQPEPARPVYPLPTGRQALA